MTRQRYRPTATHARVQGDLRAMLRRADRPIVVAVGGDSGSGKSTYTQGIERLLGDDLVSTLTLDGYHKENRAQRRRSGRSPLDPRANHIPLIREHLEVLQRGEAVEVPIYNHETGEFGLPRLFRPAPVVIIEGLHALYPDFLPFLDFRLFVDSDRQVKRQWKYERDVFRRGYEPDEAREEMKRREADYARWINFQKTNADVVIKIHESELRSLALDDYPDEIPDNCYHMEIIVSPTETILPALYMPIDLNSMTHKDALPFMLANVPSSYWGNAVNVVHVDGMVPAEALRQLEAEIMRLSGIPLSRIRLASEPPQFSTILFAQLLIAWPFLGHVISTLRQREEQRVMSSQSKA